jgi:hypothetical protein
LPRRYSTAVSCSSDRADEFVRGMAHSFSAQLASGVLHYRDQSGARFLRRADRLGECQAVFADISNPYRSMAVMLAEVISVAFASAVFTGPSTPGTLVPSGSGFRFVRDQGALDEGHSLMVAMNRDAAPRASRSASAPDGR